MQENLHSAHDMAVCSQPAEPAKPPGNIFSEVSKFDPV